MNAHRCSRFRRAAALALAAATLTACAGLGPPEPAARQAACCASVAALPFAPLALGAETTLDFGAASPRVELPGGRSPVAALRLPDGPRPLVLDLVSSQIVPTGLAGLVAKAAMGLGPGAPAQMDALNPTVWIVDARHGLVREIAATPASAPCNRADPAGRNPVYQLHATIDEPPDRSAYLIVGTSDRQRTAPTPPRCGSVDLQVGDLGRVGLVLRSAESGEPGAAQAPAAWSREARAAPALAPPLQRGRLVVDAQRLAYDRPDGGRLVRVVDLPLDGLVSVERSAGAPLALSITSVEGSPAVLRWDSFALPADPPAGDTGFDALFERLTAQVRPDRFVQTVALAVPPWSLEPTVRIAPAGTRGTGSTPTPTPTPTPAPAGDSALYRIGQQAAAAGVVTAAPCGLCLAGGCGPAMLAPCAALFSVGAAIGGLWSAGKELLGALRRSSPPPVASAAPAAAASAAPPASAPAVTPAAPGAGFDRAALVAGFDRAALEACVARAAGEADPAVWRDQGRTGRLQIVPPPTDGGAAPAAAGARLLVEPRVTAIGLVVDHGVRSEATGPQDEARLVVETTLHAVDLESHETWTEPFAWHGRMQSLAAWAETAPDAVAGELAAACRSIAAAGVQLARRRWYYLR
jgi:hypothetical protein